MAAAANGRRGAEGTAAAAAPVERTAAAAETRSVLLQAAQRLAERVSKVDTRRLEPGRAARMLGQVTRALRDLAAMEAARSQTPQPQAATALEPRLRLATREQWRKVHETPGPGGPQ